MNKVTSRDGTATAFDRVGEGPALILVGGASTQRKDTTPLAEFLAPRLHRTVYSYDRRGRGDSGDTAPYAVEREVEDIAALIADAGGSAYVFGHSSGAVLALEAVRLLGSAIPRLALYEPPFIVDDSRPPLPSDYVAHLNELIVAGRRGDAVEYMMTQAVGMPVEAIAPMRSDPMFPGLEAVAHTLAYDGAVMGDSMSGSSASLMRWSAVTTSTLVMDGGESPAYMHNGAQAPVDVLPNAQLRTLPGQTHGVAPDVLAAELDQFVSGQ